MILARAATGARAHAFASLVALLGLVSACGGSSAAHPNVVFVLADDLGWADVGFHAADAATPNLDRLAREGLALERCYAQPACTPARAALMTGRSAMRLGLGYAALRPWSPGGLPSDERTLPQPFVEAGYQTWLVGKWHLGHGNPRALPQARGFEHFYGHLNGRVGYYDHRRTGGLDWQRNGVSVEEEGYATDLQAAEAERLILGRDPSRPFFLVLASSAPHRPLKAPPEGLQPQPGQDRDEAIYRSMVSSLDRALGRVLDVLEDEGLSEDTLVVFVSDNGAVEPASNAPLRGAKGSVHEGGVRVPCVLRWPGVLAPGTRSDALVGFEDWLPTLAAAAGVRLGRGPELDGVDLWARLRDGGDAGGSRSLHFASAGLEGLESAVLRWPWKLVRSQASDGGAVRESLFHLERDPTESEDLAAREVQQRDALAAELDAWLALEPEDGLRFGEGRPPAGWQVPDRWAEAVGR